MYAMRFKFMYFTGFTAIARSCIRQHYLYYSALLFSIPGHYKLIRIKIPPLLLEDAEAWALAGFWEKGVPKSNDNY